MASHLGNSVREIAAEKAGIIKPGAPPIFDGSSGEASEGFRHVASARGSECREITNHAYEIREITDKYIAFSRVNAYDDSIVWRLSATGSYQVMNAA